MDFVQIAVTRQMIGRKVQTGYECGYVTNGNVTEKLKKNFEMSICMIDISQPEDSPDKDR